MEYDMERITRLMAEVENALQSLYELREEDIKDIEEFLSRLSEVLQEGMSQ